MSAVAGQRWGSWREHLEAGGLRSFLHTAFCPWAGKARQSRPGQQGEQKIRGVRRMRTGGEEVVTSRDPVEGNTAAQVLHSGAFAVTTGGSGTWQGSTEPSGGQIFLTWDLPCGAHAPIPAPGRLTWPVSCEGEGRVCHSDPIPWRQRTKASAR